MKKIVIFNLRKLGDIIASNETIAALKASNPDSELHLVIYKESEKATQCLTNITKVHTIDRNRLLTFKASKLFSDALAINQLENDLSDIYAIQWDEAINYSNDPVASFLMKYISADKRIGSWISEEKISTTSNLWAEVLNEVLPTKRFSSPLNLLEVYRKMTGTGTLDRIDGELNSISENDQIVAARFNELKSLSNNDKKIVGIQLVTSEKSKDIPVNKLIELINHMLDANEFQPILLVAPNDKEKAVADQINKQFDNKLLSIECDIMALVSVTKKLDFLVTPDTLVKHIADSVRTPCLEVSLGNSPVFRQSSTYQKSLILRPHLGDANAVESSHIYQLLQVMAGTRSKNQLSIYNGVTVYRPLRIDNDILYIPHSGEIRVQFEQQRVFSKFYINELAKEKTDHNLLTKFISGFEEKEINQWVDNENTKLNEKVKQVLSILRHIRTSIVNRQQSTSLFNHIEKLLTGCDENSLVSIALCLCRGRLERISSTNYMNMLKDLEQLMYEVRNDIQTLSSFLNEVTQIEYQLKKDALREGVSSTL